MKRRITVLVLSLAVLGVVLTFWVRSHVLGDTLRWRRSPQQWEVLSVDGLLVLSGGELTSDYTAPEGWKGSFWPFERPRDYIIGAPGIWEHTYSGFWYHRFNRRTTTRVNDGVEVDVPYWCVALLAGGAAVWSVRLAWLAVRSWKRAKQGRCVRCGYDLRATPARCPECGTGIHEGGRVGKRSLTAALDGQTHGTYKDVLADDRREPREKGG